MLGTLRIASRRYAAVGGMRVPPNGGGLIRPEIPFHHRVFETPCNTSVLRVQQTTAVRGMATKKAGGSSNNGRDSAGRRLGIKVYPPNHCRAGSVLVRQRGQKFRAGEHVGMGKDHTLFAKTDGNVYMTKLPTNKKRNVVHIRPSSSSSSTSTSASTSSTSQSA